MKLKYKINHYLSIIPRHLQIEDISILLTNNYGISYSSFHQHRNILLKSNLEIPKKDLFIYASVLSVLLDRKDITPATLCNMGTRMSVSYISKGSRKHLEEPAQLYTRLISTKQG